MKTLQRLFLPLICMFSFPGLSSAQDSENEFLSRYSYPIFAVTGQQQHTGTAFFYRAGDSSFLVSNYHAIKGMSPLRQVINFNTDTLYLKYPVKHSGEFRLMAIDISEEVTGKTEIFSMVDRIDLFKIPISEPADAEIFYINDLIDESYLHVIPDEVVAFGFPPGTGAVPVFYSQQEKLNGRVNESGFREYDASLKINFPGTSDTARAIVTGSSRYYYFIRPYAAQGYSGAPVFGKFRTRDNKVVYRFTGVIFGAQPSTQQTWAIKGSVVLKYLEGEL